MHPIIYCISKTAGHDCTTVLIQNQLFGLLTALTLQQVLSKTECESRAEQYRDTVHDDMSIYNILVSDIKYNI